MEEVPEEENLTKLFNLVLWCTAGQTVAISGTASCNASLRLRTPSLFRGFSETSACRVLWGRLTTLLRERHIYTEPAASFLWSI